VPCGVTDHGVTSLVDQGLPVTMDELMRTFDTAFAAAPACG
jgi:lipoate-protein ligase B